MTGRAPENAGSGGLDDLGLLESLLAEEGVELGGLDSAIRIAARPTRIPLSFSQELLWLLERASPGMTAYKLPFVRRVTGSPDIAALERSLGAIVARHEILRTRFPAVDGEPVQLIDPVTPLHLVVIDLRAASDAAAEAERIVLEHAAKPFDLADEHMFRPLLIRLASNDNVLLIDTHHIVFDGWSRDVFFRELGECYRAFRAGSEPSLAPLPIQFADYALWQRRHLAGDRLKELLEFWRTRLADASEPLDLPTDHPRDAAPGYAGARTSVVLPPDTLMALKELARRHDATLYMVLLAGYMTVLHRYSGSAVVLVGSGSAGRTHTETESLIGYLNNTLVQRGDFADDPTFSSLLSQVRESALGAYDHQEVPLEKLVLELRQGQERLGAAPLFRAVLTMQDALDPVIELDDLVVGPFGVTFGATKFDLTLLPSERGDGLHLVLQYRADLFESASAVRFLGHLGQVLAGAIDDAEQPVARMPLLAPQEHAQLRGWNDSSVDFGNFLAVHRRFEAWARRRPDTVAVRCGERFLSYGELDRRANQLANRLRTMDVERGGVVAIALDRSVDAIVALLAVLKAGAAYVPIAPDTPAPRLADQLRESGARIAITLSAATIPWPSTVALLCIDAPGLELESEPDSAPDVQVAKEDLAYVLFTSGSTGTPKGVAVSHGNIANYTAAISRVLALDDTVPLQFATVSTLAADLGNTAIFPALTTGGTLHVIPGDLALDGPRYAANALVHPIDVLKITPSHLRALMVAAGGAAGEILPRQCLVVGGEACDWELVEAVRRVGRCRMINHYGPTEATVGASTYPVGPRDAAPLAATVPIGWPLANAQLHVLDAAMELLPIGVPGELFIGGAGISIGYLHRPDLTAGRFVEIAGLGRVYRTGDRVRRLPDGAIEYLGRIDTQVKIRGFRVELGEIEQVIGRCPGVEQCALTWDSAHEILAAFVVARTTGYSAAHGDRPTPERIRAWAAENLPEYMVPSRVIMLDALPLTANGKLDRRALVVPPEAGPGDSHVAPRNPTEEALSVIWADALKRERVGVRDNFFALGGHSLIAIRVLGKVSRAFNIRLSLRALFEAPTVAELAELLDLELKLAAIDRVSAAEATSSAQEAKPSA